MSDCFVQIHIEGGTVFCLNNDGTYVLNAMSCDNTENNNTVHSKEDSYLLQCYSNGYINKTSFPNLLQLRKNYTYSHGIFTGDKLQYCNVCANDDFIIALFEKEGKKYITIRSAAVLTAHSMLGLKGDSFVKTTFDIIRNWHILPNEQSHKVHTIIALCSHNSYISTHNQECSNELLWLNSEVFKIHGLQTHGTEQSEPTLKPEARVSDEDFDFSSLIGPENEDLLRDKFSGYLKGGRNIPIGQSHVKDVLSLCKSTEDFWRTIICLLECNIKVYRSPIVSYINNSPNNLYTPDYKALKTVIELIFSITDKIEKNLEFLYPFRKQLSQEDLSLVKSAGKNLSQPEHYHILGALLNYTPQELIEFCLNNASPASYYCIYEVLQKYQKKEGFFGVNKLIDSIYMRFENSGIKGKLIKNLIFNEFKKNRNYLSPDIIKIKEGGYREYSKICYSYEGKKKHQESLNKIASLVGKKVEVKYTRTYQNHYLMTYSGIRVLLPKCVTTDYLTEGSVANVLIAMADKPNNTLYATQKEPVDYKKILQTPLLNSGDIIEVTFDLNGYPIAHKCYKKVKVSIDYIPKNIDYKARYEARVIRQTSDKYHYLVKLI